VKKYIGYLLSVTAAFCVSHESLRAAAAPPQEGPEAEVKARRAQQAVGISSQEFLDRVLAHAEGKQTPAEAPINATMRKR
jgi:hypothetical protein